MSDAIEAAVDDAAITEPLREATSTIASLTEQVEQLTRERDEQRVMFIYEADKHSEWLEKCMDMKRRAEAAERKLDDALATIALLQSQYRTQQEHDTAVIASERARAEAAEAKEGMRKTTNAIPNPGSDEAIAKGCTCSVLDNGHGHGYPGQPGVFVYRIGCPVHAPAITTNGTGTSGQAPTRTAYGTGRDL